MDESSSSSGQMNFAGSAQPVELKTEESNGVMDVDVKDTSREDGIVKQEDEGESCSVCLGRVIEATALDNCPHIFCFCCIRQWLKHCETARCPLCKSDVTYLIKNVGCSDETRLSLDQLRAIFEAEIRQERGNAVPLLQEKEVITARMHVLRTYINQLEQDLGRVDLKKSRSKAELKRRYQGRVSDLTALRVLSEQIDDRSITRGELIGNPRFRVLVYICDAEWYQVDPNANPGRKSFTSQVCRADEASHRERILPWIRRELMFVLKSEKQRVYINKHRSEVADTIFNTCVNHQIHSPTFRSIMVAIGISSNSVERFQHEIFEFASSNLAMEDHYSISGYRMPPTQQRGRGARAAGNFSVGGLSDNFPAMPNDIPLVTLNEEPDDVIVLEDGQPPNASQRNYNESNYLRDEPASSGSDPDADLYMRRACLLRNPRNGRARTQAPPPQPRSLEVADLYGHEWRVGMGLTNPALNIAPDLPSWRMSTRNRFRPLQPPSIPDRPSRNGCPLPGSSDHHETTVCLSSDDDDDVVPLDRANRNDLPTSSGMSRGAYLNPNDGLSAGRLSIAGALNFPPWLPVEEEMPRVVAPSSSTSAITGAPAQTRVELDFSDILSVSHAGTGAPDILEKAELGVEDTRTDETRSPRPNRSLVEREHTNGQNGVSYPRDNNNDVDDQMDGDSDDAPQSPRSRASADSDSTLPSQQMSSSTSGSKVKSKTKRGSFRSHLRKVTKDAKSGLGKEDLRRWREFLTKMEPLTDDSESRRHHENGTSHSHSS